MYCLEWSLDGTGQGCSMFYTESNQLSSVCPRYKRKQEEENLVGVGNDVETVIKDNPFDSVNREQRNSIVAGEGYGNKEGCQFCFCFKVLGHIYLHLGIIHSRGHPHLRI